MSGEVSNQRKKMKTSPRQLPTTISSGPSKYKWEHLGQVIWHVLWADIVRTNCQPHTLNAYRFWQKGEGGWSVSVLNILILLTHILSDEMQSVTIHVHIQPDKTIASPLASASLLSTPTGICHRTYAYFFLTLLFIFLEQVDKTNSHDGCYEKN